MPPDKVLTYVEYSVQRRGGTNAPGGGGGWGVNILEDARHWIGLLQYNLPTPLPYSVKRHNIKNYLYLFEFFLYMLHQFQYGEYKSRYMYVSIQKLLFYYSSLMVEVTGSVLLDVAPELLPGVQEVQPIHRHL